MAALGCSLVRLLSDWPFLSLSAFLFFLVVDSSFFVAVRLLFLYAAGLMWLAESRYYIIKDATGSKEKLLPTLLLHPPAQPER